MPDVFDHGSNLKWLAKPKLSERRLVGTAGFSPATSRSQAARSKD
jgi:hypothetical protein